MTTIKLRQFLLVTHRWLGLASSAVLAIVGVTGVFLLWRERPSWPQHDLIVYAGRVSEPLHYHLALGEAGSLLIATVTGLAILIELGGLILWWQRKILWVRRSRGWWRTCFDLHHLVGVILLPLMLLLAVTGFAMVVLDIKASPELWRTMARLHRGQYPFPIDFLYAIASVGFLVQGLTGLAMWWRPNAVRTTRVEVGGVSLQEQ